MKTRFIDAKITQPDGSIVFQKDNFEIPEFWSDTAGTIMASKYAMDSENSALEIIDRVVKKIVDWGIEKGYFESPFDFIGHEKDTDYYKFSEELKDILVNQRASFNSPVWFNLGADTGVSQGAACFVLAVEDTMESILDNYKTEGMIFKGGSGAGINVSKLRGKGEKLSNKGSSTGSVSFMKGWDSNAGTIRSGGKQRRAAKLVCMNDDHPDLMEFIECKKLEEDKAKILIQSGIPAEEAYATVAYQNTNHSVQVTDKFMNAVENDEMWMLKGRKDPSVNKELPAREIFDKIAEIAWYCGDPGLQFADRMNRDNPVPSLGRIETTNPCGELVAVNNSSCNLSSLNLVKYFDGVQGTNWELFTDDINIMITAMDIICGSADYPTEEIKEVTLKTRPLGLGFTNLGAFLMMCGLPYASQEARDLTGKITKYMTKTAYCQSVALAKKLGPFPAFEENKEKCAEVLCNVAVSGMFTDRFNEFGLRNSQVTLLAPCGTISILMDCDSFGVEPLFALKSFKRLSGGGSLEFEPNCVKFAKEKFGDSVTNLYQTANELSWKDHIDMLATCQNHLSGGISKTVNMRNDSTIEDIKEAYMYAWKSGCKGITVYRDGSKDLQPLTDISKEKKETFINHSHIVTSIIDHPPLRIKPPKTHKSITHVADIAGHRFRIIAGMYPDGSMCELFISMSKEGSTLSGIMNGLSRSVSLGLQYGVPLKAICDQFMGMSFEPAGITTTEEIPIAKSILDYIGRWLESEFLLKEFDEDEDEDSEFSGLEEIKPEKKVKVNQKIWESENISEFDGPPCLNCGSMTLRSGSCYVCTQCATTTGCS